VVPRACEGCPHLETCGGGCASRRLLRGRLDRPDEYCPYARGDEVALPTRAAPGGRVALKASSACTTIVRARASTAAAEAS
jgi:hypothetical protein